MTLVQTRRSRVQERFQEGSIHLLKQPIVKDTGLELADRLRLEEIQALRCHNAGNKIFARSRFNLETRLRKEHCLGAQGLACPSLADSSDAMLTHCRQHLGQDVMEKPRHEGLQSEWPILQRLGILSASVVIAEGFSYFAFVPAFKLPAGHVDLFICPLHELVAVVGARPEVPDESIAFCSCTLI